MTLTNDGLNDEALAKVQELLKSGGWKYDNGKWVPVAKQEPSGIVKQASKQLVFGWANVIKDVDGNVVVDRQGDFVDDEWEIEKAAYDYNLYSRDGGNMHIQKGVADLVESMVFTPEKTRALGIPDKTVPTGWWLGFHVHDAATWAGVEKQEFTGFSVHGNGLRKDAVLDGIAHVLPQ